MLFNQIVAADETLLLKRGVTSSIIEIPNDECRAVLIPWAHVATIQRVGDRGQVKTIHGSGFDFEAKTLFEEICIEFSKYLVRQGGEDFVEVDMGPDVGD